MGPGHRRQSAAAPPGRADLAAGRWFEPREGLVEVMLSEGPNLVKDVTIARSGAYRAVVGWPRAKYLSEFATYVEPSLK